MQRPYPDAIREGHSPRVGRSVCQVRLAGAGRNLSPRAGTSTKDGLAVALGNIVDDDTLDELIALARDAGNGPIGFYF